MRTILAPIDFSDVTDDVMQEAFDLARAFCGTVVLLHVIPPYGYPIEFYADAGFVPPLSRTDSLQEELKQCRSRMEKMAEPFQTDEVTMEVRVEEGDPVMATLDIAENIPADTIVMGSHGHGALYHLLLGGVAERVLHRAACPVLIVQSHPKTTREIPAHAKISA